MAEYLEGGTVSGSSTLSTPAANLTIDFSGRVEGYSIVSDGFVKDGAGTVEGTSTLSAPGVALTREFAGVVDGGTTLSDISAFGVHGLSSLGAVCDVIRPPGAQVGIQNTGKSFRWAQQLSRGDLVIFVTPAPFEVTFTIFTNVRGAWFQVGASNRRPLTANLGEYYAALTAGEGGQPGDWRIQWSLRRTFNSPVVVETHQFRVVDAVSSPLQGDSLTRVRKFGWS